MKKHLLPTLVFGYFSIFCLTSCSPGKTNDPIASDSSSIARGQVLFHTNCSGCHNFKQDGIGPSLAGITEMDSINRLRQFIRSPKTLIESGDERAKKLLLKYHTIMPSFSSLNDDQTNQLIAFLHTQKGRKKEKEDPNAIKNPFPEKIAASGIQADLDFITQIPPNSDKEPLTRISKMDWVPAANTWFVLDQRGKLYKLVNGKAITWLDISKWKPDFINEPGLATGFGSFAFHPDFARNGLFYTTHSERPHTKKADFAIPDSINQTLQWVLCEWKMNDPLSSSAFTCRELMRIDMVAGIHGVQEIIFNPLVKPADEDYGNLYIGVGDGGSVENGYAFLTHHPDKIWGSILRINPRGNNSANGQYGIPTSNPFTKNPDPNTVRELYADGFRNPNRITWTKKGIMLATNIGQAQIESVNIILKGHDYGWPQREGPFAMHDTADINKIYPLPANDSAFHITYPVAAFDHDEGNAIAGGFEYTGKNLPQLTGKYLFGDIPSGRLFYVNLADLKLGKLAVVKEWFVSLNGKRITLRGVCGQNRVDLRFARDEKGEMYIFTKPDGKIYRLRNITKKLPEN
jgi:mono/diheme cytochrome c family protein